MLARWRDFCLHRPQWMILLAGVLLPLSYAPVKFLPLFYLSFGLAFYLAWHHRGHAARLFKLGWLFGFGQFFVGFYWIGEAFLVEAEDFLWALPFAVTLLPAGLALFGGLAFWAFGASLRVLAGDTQRGDEAPRYERAMGFVWLAVLWAVAEYARASILTGLPWNLPVMGWASWLYLAQPVALLGVHGLGLVALVSVALLFGEGRAARLGGLALPLAALVYSLSVLHAPGPEMAPAAPVMSGQPQIIVVQPNINQVDKWRADQRDAHIEATFALTRRAQASIDSRVNGAPIVVWPETAIPALIDEDPRFAQALPSLLPHGGYLLTGTIRRWQEAGRQHYFNSAMLWRHDGQLMARSDKHHLVPFGEYLPMRPLLEAIGLRQLTRLRGSLAAGPAHARFQAPDLPMVAPLICYEAIFPYLSAGQPRPAWLVNLTNDGWFGRSLGPYQHLAQVRLRAIEQGLPLIRSANTGVSAAFDGRGRLLNSVPLGQAGWFHLTLPPAEQPTAYARYGDSGFGFLCVFLVLICISVWRRSKKS